MEEKEFSLDDITFATGKVFVITGAFSETRDKYEAWIKSMGGTLAKSVTKKTDFLLTNDTESGTIKNKRAKELGIPVINEYQFVQMCQRRGN